MTTPAAGPRHGAGARAREVLEREGAGVLATISERHAGAPFASLASYALGADGAPVFLFSALAQHTRNLDADPRATLYVEDRAPRDDDPQQRPRLAIVGRAVRAPAASVAAARDAYLARHPQAEPLLALDFALFRLEPEEIHWVGGFASATWLSPGAVLGA